MAIALGGFDQALDLALSEIAAFNCQVYDAWRAGLGCLICHAKSLSCWYEWKDNRLFLHSLQLRYLAFLYGAASHHHACESVLRLSFERKEKRKRERKVFLSDFYFFDF